MLMCETATIESKEKNKGGGWCVILNVAELYIKRQWGILPLKRGFRSFAPHDKNKSKKSRRDIREREREPSFMDSEQPLYPWMSADAGY